MELFLMVATMSLMGVAVSALLFAAATRQEGPLPPQLSPRPEAEPSRFFAEDAVGAAEEDRELLTRIERHIRLEQAAAEAFLSAPTAEALHGRSRTPLSH